MSVKPFDAPATRTQLWLAIACSLGKYDLSKLEVRIGSKADERRDLAGGRLFHVRHDGKDVVKLNAVRGGFVIDAWNRNHDRPVIPDPEGVAEALAPILKPLVSGEA